MPNFLRTSPGIALFCLWLNLPQQAWSCEAQLDLARFYQTYDSMISGTISDQETAAAVFLTTPRAHPSEIADHRLRRALTSAEALANNIRHNRRATAAELAHHRRHLQWVKDATEETPCDSSTPAHTNPKVSGIRSTIAITISTTALLAFLIIARPRGTLLWRWLRKRSIRRDLHMILHVRVEEEGQDPGEIRVRGIDVTEGGIQLFWPGGAPAPGSRLTVLLPDLEKTAAVVWSNTFLSGVAFDERLATEQVKSLAQTAIKLQTATQ